MARCAFGKFPHVKSLIVPALCGLSLLLSVPAHADTTKNCHIGSYRLSDGQAFDIAPSDGDALRWRAFGAEHGMTEYELKPDGTRVSTRFAPGYFAMMRDFIRDGHIGDHYGKAEITQPRVH
jgi:hypothetical protein